MNVTDSITTTLSHSLLCRRILRFLLQNSDAMDTSRGIASWWLQCDEMAARTAIDQLLACGVLVVHTLSSGSVYGLTQDRQVRKWLAQMYTRDFGERAEPETNSTTSVTTCLLATQTQASGGHPA